MRMRMLLTGWWVAGAVAGVAGCATSPTPAERTEPGTLLDKPLTTARSGTGIILVKRDSGLTGAGCTLRIALDGTPAADLRGRQAVVLYASPGDHELNARNVSGDCQGDESVRVEVRAGQRATFRAGIEKGNVRLRAEAP